MTRRHQAPRDQHLSLDDLPDMTEVDRLYPDEVLSEIIRLLDCVDQEKRTNAEQGVRDAAWQYQIGLMPQAQYATVPQRRQKLTELNNAVRAVLMAIDDIGPDAGADVLNALEPRLRFSDEKHSLWKGHPNPAKRWLTTLRHNLGILHQSSGCSVDKLGEKRSRPEKYALLILAVDLALVYRKATGLEPTRSANSGGFKHFAATAVGPLRVHLSDEIIKESIKRLVNNGAE